MRKRRLNRYHAVCPTHKNNVKYLTKFSDIFWHCIKVNFASGKLQRWASVAMPMKIEREVVFFIHLHDFHADINECSSNPCLNGGSCVDQVNRYVCNCQAGYIGSRCQSQLSCKSIVRCKRVYMEYQGQVKTLYFARNYRILCFKKGLAEVQLMTRFQLIPEA